MITKIGKYEIRAELGHDAFARTFRALDADAGRPVTVLLLTAVADSRRIAAFRNDAAIAANLHHNKIAAVYELGEDAGLPFIAMQHLQGEDLGQVIEKQTPLTLLQKMLLMFDVADALKAAHQGGITHAGIRPASIILGGDGSAKITELGAVRLVLGNGSGSAQASARESLYTAPEQLTSAAPPDALSDIFAYGAIYYELLAGCHPFGAANAIVHDEPAPLRTLAPDCPEALEQIIHRALEPDRDLRYQSLEDVQCDAEPIIQELKRERAASLLIEARGLVAGQEWERAQGVAREVLELEPGNREGRRLRDNIREEVQRRIIRSRLDALVQRAKEQLLARNFAEAIQILESGLRLDAAETAIPPLLDEARALLERSEQAQRILAEAQHLFERGDLQEARRRVSAALEHDPASDAAHQLLESIEERERTIENVRGEALALCDARDFAAAIRLLQRWLQSFPDEAQLAWALDDAVAAKAAYERGQAIAKLLEESQWLLDQSRPDLAVALLRQNATTYPGDAELAARLAAAEAALSHWESRRSIEETLARVAALEQRAQWRAALTVAEEALKAHPDAAELAAAAERLDNQLRENEGQRKLARLLDGISQSLAAGELEQAEESLRGALELWPAETRLAALKEELKCEKAYQDQWRQAEVLFGRGQLLEAERLLLELAKRKPNNADVQALLETVRSGRADSDEKQFRERGRMKALRLIEERQLDEGIDLLRNLLLLFPNDPILERDLQSALAQRGETREHKSAVVKQDPPPAPVAAAAPARAPIPDALFKAVEDLSWRRPVLLIPLMLLVVTAATLPLWRLSRKPQSVALASPSPAPTKPAIRPVTETRPSPPPTSQPTVPSSAAPKKPSPTAARRVLEAFSVWRSSPTPIPAPPVAAPPAGIQAPAVSVPAGLPGASMQPIASPPAAAARVAVADSGPTRGKPERIRVGGEFHGPQLISGPNVVIPPLARERKIYGTVKLEATISKEGTVTSVDAVSGPPLLLEAAKQAILARRYEPATLNGDPVEIKLPVQVVFDAGR